MIQVPKPKPLTRWEKFAKLKGIQNRKQSRKVFDEATGEWVPRWGYKGANDDGANDWLIPVRQNAGIVEESFFSLSDVYLRLNSATNT